MLNITRQTNHVFSLMVAVMFFTSSAVLVDKPAWAGNEGKDKNHENQDRAQSHDDRNSDQHHGKGGKVNAYFNDYHRNAIHEYYSEQYRKGKCPPGLAKKHNGCMPPGQARKWHIGKPLPRDVTYHNLPESVLSRLGTPPSRQRFVRVDSDILLLTIGTGIVIDAIENLSAY